MEKIRKESLVAELLAILYIQKKQIQLTFLVVFLGFLSYAMLAPSTYRASGSFLVKAKKIERHPNHRSANAVEKNDAKESGITEDDIYTESEILSSDEVLTKTAINLVKKKLINLDGSGKNEQLAIDELAKKLNTALNVEVLPTSKVVRPTLLWSDPKEASVILNTLMWVYLEQRQQLENPEQTTEYLNNQVNVYLTDWKNKKSELLSLSEKYNAPDPALELSNNMELKKDYLLQINELEEKRDALKADAETLGRMLADGENHLYSFLNNDVLASFVGTMQSTQKEKEEAEQIFLPKRIEAKEATAQLQRGYKTIKNEANLQLQQQRSTLKNLNQTLVSLTNKVHNLEKRNLELKNISVQMEQIQLESSLMASSFESFYNKRDESKLRGILEANVAILSHAKADLSAIKPMRGEVLLLGFVLAVVLSLSVAFVLNSFNQTIKIPRDIEKFVAVPVMFSIEDLHDKKVDRSDKILFYGVLTVLTLLLSIYFVKSFMDYKKSTSLAAKQNVGKLKY